MPSHPASAERPTLRILLVAYYFPPFNSVGAVRPGKLARYLRERGHDVRVLTCSNQPYPEGLPLEVPGGCVTATSAWSVNAPIEWFLGGRNKVAREGFAGGAPRPALKHLGNLYRTFFHWPDAQVGWVRGAVHAGRKLLARERYDLIYASAPPFSALRVAAALSRASGVPWIAELRDLWTGNHGYAYPAWRRVLERVQERRVLRSARALVTISAPLVEKLRSYRLPVWEVRNGCDAEDFAHLARPACLDSGAEGLDLVFTGNVYDGPYDVHAFCEGLRLHRDQGGIARVHVAGRNTAVLQQAAERFDVADAFRFHSTLPRETALAMQLHADALLFFPWAGDAGDGIYSLKLFEYAGAGRPVLAVGPAASFTGRLVEEAGLGRTCADSAAVAACLKEWEASKRSGRLARGAPRAGFDLTRRTQFADLEQRLSALVQTEGA